jgi:hypothetical protein
MTLLPSTTSGPAPRVNITNPQERAVWVRLIAGADAHLLRHGTAMTTSSAESVPDVARENHTPVKGHSNFGKERREKGYAEYHATTIADGRNRRRATSG